jgi:hypothetical protein
MSLVKGRLNFFVGGEWERFQMLARARVDGLKW